MRPSLGSGIVAALAFGGVGLGAAAAETYKAAK